MNNKIKLIINCEEQEEATIYLQAPKMYSALFEMQHNIWRDLQKWRDFHSIASEALPHLEEKDIDVVAEMLDNLCDEWREAIMEEIESNDLQI